jgi:hypothetical protein
VSSTWCRRSPAKTASRTRTPPQAGSDHRMCGRPPELGKIRSGVVRFTTLIKIDLEPGAVQSRAADKDCRYCCRLPFSRGIGIRGRAARTGRRVRIRRGRRWNSENPSDRACRRSHRTADDGTNRAGCLTTSLGAVLGTTNCSLSTGGTGSQHRSEQGCPEGQFAHVALRLINHRSTNIPLAGKKFRCRPFLDRQSVRASAHDREQPALAFVDGAPPE